MVFLGFDNIDLIFLKILLYTNYTKTFTSECVLERCNILKGVVDIFLQTEQENMINNIQFTKVYNGCQYKTYYVVSR